MRYVIPCDTYIRFAKVASKETPFNCIRIEKNYIIAHNRKVMVVEKNDQSFDGIFHLTVDPMFVAVCDQDNEKSNANIIIDTVDGLPMASAYTTENNYLLGNADANPDRSDWDRWKSCVPESMPSESHGFMFMDAELMESLCIAAPSKKLLFPAHIDMRKPTVVRDSFDPSWFGVIHLRNDPASGDKTMAARYPDWFHHD